MGILNDIYDKNTEEWPPTPRKQSVEIYGEEIASPNGKYRLIWNKGEHEGGVPMGVVYLLREQEVLLKKDISRPANGAVSDTGSFIIEDTRPWNSERTNLYIINAKGVALLKRQFYAEIFNRHISHEKNIFLCQTLPTPGSVDNGTLAVFDFERGVELASWRPLSGLATSYRLNLDGSLSLEYKNLGSFRYSLQGDFLDLDIWQEAVLKASDVGTLGIAAQKIKTHGQQLSHEDITSLEEYIESAIDRINKTYCWQYAHALELKGRCLELRGDLHSALSVYEESLRRYPNPELLQHIDKIKKI